MERKALRAGNLSSSSSPNSEEHIIQIPNLDADQTEEKHSPLFSQSQILQQPHTPRRRAVPASNFDPNPTHLPPAFANTHHHHHTNYRRLLGFRVRRLFEARWVLHLIPLILIFSFFLLWLFSNPVNLAIKDGRFMQQSSTVRPFSLNDTDLNLSRMTMLAVSTLPNPNIELMLSVIDKAGDSASPLSSST